MWACILYMRNLTLTQRQSISLQCWFLFYCYNLDLPLQWVKPVEKYTEHKLTKGSTEWKDVETDFLKTLKRSNAAVLKVG